MEIFKQGGEEEESTSMWERQREIEMEVRYDIVTDWFFTTLSQDNSTVRVYTGEAVFRGSSLSSGPLGPRSRILDEFYFFI